MGLQNLCSDCASSVLGLGALLVLGMLLQPARPHPASPRPQRCDGCFLQYRDLLGNNPHPTQRGAKEGTENCLCAGFNIYISDFAK